MKKVVQSCGLNKRQQCKHSNFNGHSKQRIAKNMNKGTVTNSVFYSQYTIFWQCCRIKISNLNQNISNASYDMV